MSCSMVAVAVDAPAVLPGPSIVCLICNMGPVQSCSTGVTITSSAGVYVTDYRGALVSKSSCDECWSGPGG